MENLLRVVLFISHVQNGFDYISREMRIKEYEMHRAMEDDMIEVTFLGMDDLKCTEG